MRLRLAMTMLVGAIVSAPLVACGDDEKSDPTTSAGDTTSSTDTTTTTTTTSATETSTPTETVEETTGDPVTWDEVAGIFHLDCVPCHETAPGSGAHTIGAAELAASYAASQQDANIPKCDGLKVGECALLRIKDGSMPASGDCATDPKGAKCPTAEEQAQIQQWIDDGMQGPAE